jgi:hypothetical protein
MPGYHIAAYCVSPQRAGQWSAQSRPEVAGTDGDHQDADEAADQDLERAEEARERWRQERRGARRALTASAGWVRTPSVGRAVRVLGGTGRTV